MNEVHYNYLDVWFIPATFNYILRGEGNTFIPMLTMLIGAILNIILDPLVIFGIGFFPRLGIEGAAYATIFSRFVGGLFITYIIFSDKNEITLKLKDFSFDWSIIKEIYQVGIPAMINRLLFSTALIFINRILGSFNTTAIAVMGIIFRLQSFFLMSVFGLNQGYLPLVGYNYGHKKPQPTLVCLSHCRSDNPDRFIVLDEFQHEERHSGYAVGKLRY